MSADDWVWHELGTLAGGWWAAGPSAFLNGISGVLPVLFRPSEHGWAIQLLVCTPSFGGLVRPPRGTLTNERVSVWLGSLAIG